MRLYSTETKNDLGRFSSNRSRQPSRRRKSLSLSLSRTLVGCQGKLEASGLALQRHDHSVKLSTFMVEPEHSLVFIHIYQEPERLTITKGFVAAKQG
jgi:hypothetical protein